MGDGIQLDTTDISRVVTVLGGVAEAKRYQVQRKLQDSAQKIYDASQQEIAVDTGEAKDSGRVVPYVEDADHIAFDVTYGDGSANGKTYDYGDGKIADGHPWFLELGTSKMPAQPFLGPSFEEESQNLVNTLGDIFS